MATQLEREKSRTIRASNSNKRLEQATRINSNKNTKKQLQIDRIDQAKERRRDYKEETN